MAFGGKVNHGIGAKIGKQAVQFTGIVDVGLGKLILRMVGKALQGLQVACVSEFVDIENVYRISGENVADEGRANEARAACYDDFGCGLHELKPLIWGVGTGLGMTDGFRWPVVLVFC